MVLCLQIMRLSRYNGQNLAHKGSTRSLDPPHTRRIANFYTLLHAANSKIAPIIRGRSSFERLAHTSLRQNNFKIFLTFSINHAHNTRPRMPPARARPAPPTLRCAPIKIICEGKAMAFAKIIFVASQLVIFTRGICYCKHRVWVGALSYFWD